MVIDKKSDAHDNKESTSCSLREPTQKINLNPYHSIQTSSNWFSLHIVNNDLLPSTFYSPTDQSGKWDRACDIHVPGGFHLGEGLERAGLAAGLGRDTEDLDTTGVLEPTGLTLDLVTETNHKTIKCVIHIQF